MTTSIGTFTPIKADLNKIDHFEKIPDEMLLFILNKLNENDLNSTFLVNKRWNNITLIIAQEFYQNFLNILFSYGSDSD